MNSGWKLTHIVLAEGNLRLAGRVDINGFATGALQIFHDGAFGAVCRSSFDAPDAEVACRQLGFGGGTPLPLAIASRSDFDSIAAPQVLNRSDIMRPVLFDSVVSDSCA